MEEISFVETSSVLGGTDGSLNLSMGGETGEVAGTSRMSEKEP